MNTNMIVTAEELIAQYNEGCRRGFATGVIFSVMGYALIRKMNRDDQSRWPNKDEFIKNKTE